MTEVIQRFLLRNTRWLQYVVNEKLAKREGRIGKFFRWMEIGPRNNGEHVTTKFFRFWNMMVLNFGYRFNWGRPHLTKIFSREREIYICGYAGIFLFWAWYARKNKIRPLYQSRDLLNDYDNPAYYSQKYKRFIPFNYMNFKISAHFIEINRIFHIEMLKKFYQIKEAEKARRDKCSEKEKRTRYIINKNYVYEPFGWEVEQKNQ